MSAARPPEGARTAAREREGTPMSVGTLGPGSADCRWYFEDLQPGDRHRSGGRTVTEADVVNFAGLSGDFHALHMDEIFAAATPHGRRIAHGMLIVSMTAGLVARLPIMRSIEQTTLGLLNVSCGFLKPTFIGDTIRVELVVKEKTLSRKGDRGTVVMQRVVHNQRGDVVIDGLWTLMIQCREPAAGNHLLIINS